MQKNKFNKFIKLFYSLSIAFIYGSWLSSLPSFLFKDRGNYLIYATYSTDILEDIGAKGYLFFEPLFLLINKALLLLFSDPRLTIDLIVFFISFSVCFFCFYRSKNFLIAILTIFFLFVQAQSLGMQLVTIRQGLGLSFMILLIPLFKKRSQVLILLLILGLIHNSFYILTLFYSIYLIVFFKFKWSYYTKLIIFYSFGLLFSFTFMMALQMIQAKQSYEGFQFSSGGGAFLLWLIVFFYLLFFKRKKKEDVFFNEIAFELAIIGLVIYTTGYFLTPISGRIIGSFIPFIVLSLLKDFNVKDFFFFLFIGLVNIYLYDLGAFEGFLRVPLDVFQKKLFGGMCV
ncbi:EpsG family protein [Tenacibaculum discolor]|uniref:EpsG family protein n=1 Tax=Tenacibaculum discolor TaxID=361581 RepID=UPI000EB4C4DC|nr:EpsG family protein [Tenacibaculum discolor]RLJ97685.1 EpsG-like putative glucosyltransferase [Tenacibaculum discolor]